VHHIANNANFRAGVLGAEIKVQPTKRWVNALAGMRLVTKDSLNGVTYHQAAGSEIMAGNPLNAVIWLAQSLKQEGIELKKGDLLSISGFTAGVWAQSGQSVTAKYIGLPGNPVVSVNFN
jgi:2-keto-4-pentenoate hydratase